MARYQAALTALRMFAQEKGILGNQWIEVSRKFFIMCGCAKNYCLAEKGHR